MILAILVAALGVGGVGALMIFDYWNSPWRRLRSAKRKVRRTLRRGDKILAELCRALEGKP